VNCTVIEIVKQDFGASQRQVLAGGQRGLYL
jgi:hypothetical protein